MSTFWSVIEGVSSFGYKDQADYVTPASGALSTFSWLDVGPPSFTLARELIETPRLTGQVGARSQPRAGSKAGGTLKFPAAIKSQTSVWDPTAAVATSPVWDLIEEIWGAAVSGTYVAAAIESPLTAGTTFSAWKTASGTPVVGQCYATGLAAAITSLGWCKTFSATILTLTENAIAKPTAADNLYPLRTVYSSHTQPTAKTFSFVGDTADQEWRFYGCVPTGLEIGMDAKGALTAEFTYRFTDHACPGSGATQTVTDYQEVPALLGILNARYTMNGTTTGLAAETMGTLGAGTVKLSVGLEGMPILAHGGRQGEGGWQVNRRSYKVSGRIPHASARITGTQTIFDDSLENETPITLMLQAGNKPGKLFSMLIPAGRVMSQHGVTLDGSIVAYDYEIEASTYSGDGASVTAGNTVARLAYG